MKKIQRVTKKWNPPTDITASKEKAKKIIKRVDHAKIDAEKRRSMQRNPPTNDGRRLNI